MKNNSPSSETDQNLIAYLHMALNSIGTSANDKPQIKFSSQTQNTKKQLLVAISGGTDSTALIVALSKFATSFDYKLSACHINHGLRGKESDADAEYCLILCQKLNIECQIIKLDDMPRSVNNSVHINEDMLRNKRYEQLALYAKKKNIAILLTAHTLDDQVETLLFRILRGTSTTGLKGIEFSRSVNDDLLLIRPLLQHSKKQCEEYLAKNGIEARHDSSNANEIYTRNYIRHSVIPVLANRFPNFTTQLESLRHIIAAEDEFLEQTSLQLFKDLQLPDANRWSTKIFNSFPLAMQRRVLAHALKQRFIELSFRRLEDIISLIKNEPGSANCLNLNSVWRIRRLNGGDVILWDQMPEKTQSAIKLEPVELRIPGLTPIPGSDLVFTVKPYLKSEYGDFVANKQSFPLATEPFIFADLSCIASSLTIRQRRPGDRIKPLGMSQSVQLKKYIHTHKPPAQMQMPYLHSILLADQKDVLWLPGIGISEKIKVINSPSHVIQIKTK